MSICLLYIFPKLNVYGLNWNEEIEGEWKRQSKTDDGLRHDCDAEL